MYTETVLLRAFGLSLVYYNEMSTKSRPLNASARKNLSCTIYVSADVFTFFTRFSAQHDCPSLPKCTSNIEFTSIMIYVPIEQRGDETCNLAFKTRIVSFVSLHFSNYSPFLRHFANILEMLLIVLKFLAAWKL